MGLRVVLAHDFGNLLARDDLVVAEGSMMSSRLDAGERFLAVGAHSGADRRLPWR